MPTSFRSLAIAWAICLSVVFGGIALLEVTYDPSEQANSEGADAAQGEPAGPPEPVFRPIPVQASADLLEMSDQGPLPIVGADGTRSSDHYAATPVQAPDLAKIAIIVTDLGMQSRQTRRALAEMPEHTTFAFSPFGQGNNGWAEQARRANHEVLLMIPMEPVNYPQDDPGVLTLLVTNTPDQNLRWLRESLSKLTGYVGVISHKGSRFTAAIDSMRPIMNDFAARGLMYIDSQASQYTVGPQLASSLQLPIAFNSRLGFLDEEPSAAVISERLDELEKIAVRDGFAVGIIRPLPVSMDAVSIWAGGLQSRGATLAPISQIANQQPVAP